MGVFRCALLALVAVRVPEIEGDARLGADASLDGGVGVEGDALNVEHELLGDRRRRVLLVLRRLLLLLLLLLLLVVLLLRYEGTVGRYGRRVGW